MEANILLHTIPYISSNRGAVSKMKGYDKDLYFTIFVILAIILCSIMFYLAGKEAADNDCYNQAVKDINEQIKKDYRINHEFPIVIEGVDYGINFSKNEPIK